jgi:HEAT repeat protein
MSFDRGALDGMREAHASGFLVALLEQPDHRVRRNAESALQNMGDATANVAQLKQAKVGLCKSNPVYP